ncbi:CLUMA_CG015478, isoform A [Clunio marinus]|uniref:CLUMA_CG015478, isoform A n=1 Tax=Clunio marinus TaxID=568069 RepID=A0A1J1IP40_9DIPT|nr:CLUMA_CG015478, isoform A [Clunio marinus]
MSSSPRRLYTETLWGAWRLTCFDSFVFSIRKQHFYDQVTSWVCDHVYQHLQSSQVSDAAFPGSGQRRSLMELAEFHSRLIYFSTNKLIDLFISLLYFFVRPQKLRLGYGEV